MKKIIYILMVTLGVMSCNAGDDRRMTSSDLIGKWNWTSTDGGINGDIHETPTTTKKTIYLTLKADYTFLITEKGNETSSGNYILTMKESIYSGQMERYITLETTDQQAVGFVKNGIVNIDKNQILQISDNNYDGIASRFKKIE